MPNRPQSRRPAFWSAFLLAASSCGPPVADLLIEGGELHDGTGGEPFVADIAVRGDEIVFIGDAAAEGVVAARTLDASGLLVAPGFLDMHSHSQIGAAWGREALPFLHQGITTVVLGVDGGGSPAVGETLAGWEADGIGVNALTYVGHGAVRRRVLGEEDRAPTASELDRMRGLVRQGLEEGAFGLSTGLFYVPGTYAETGEVIELARVAAEYEPRIYDTHDRDLGAAYPGVGYLASIEEAIRVGEESGDEGHLQPLQRPGREELRAGARGGGARRGGAGRAGFRCSPPSMSIPPPSRASAPTPSRAGRRRAVGRRCSTASTTPM